MNEQTQSEQIEISMDHAKYLVAKRDQMQRLIKNPDFDELITRGYFDTEASRLVMAKAELDEASQTKLDKQIDAVGYTRLFLRNILQMGDMAERDILADADELALAEQEEQIAEETGA